MTFITFKSIYIRPLKNIYFVFVSLRYSEVDLLVWFASLSCCIAQVCLSFWAQWDVRQKNSWFHQLCPKLPQTIKVQPPCLRFAVLFLKCWFFFFSFLFFCKRKAPQKNRLDCLSFHYRSEFTLINWVENKLRLQSSSVTSYWFIAVVTVFAWLCWNTIWIEG